MTDQPDPQFFDSFDGKKLAWREIGEGRAVMLFHGLFSDGPMNWIRYGHAAVIAAQGFRVIMPDLRAHGASAKPHDAVSYPSDVLVNDGLALIDHLALTDYDLGGYSLGGRTTVRMLVRGARPRRAVVSGMGLSGLTDTGPRTDHFKHILDNPGSFPKFSPEWNAEAFLKTTKGDPVALRLLLDSMVDTPADAIAAIDIPALVLAGAQDDDNGSTESLADLLPQARAQRVPGGHMSAVTRPELGRAIADFLAA
ncbi:MAG: alpha/beta fold hydrolase [Sphingomonadales bacterium]